jgi:hypothetical protein
MERASVIGTHESRRWSKSPELVGRPKFGDDSLASLYPSSEHCSGAGYDRALSIVYLLALRPIRSFIANYRNKAPKPD